MGDLEQALRKLQSRERQTAVLANLGRTALSCDSLQSLFDRAVGQVAETLGNELCKVLKLMPDGNNLLLVSGVGWQKGLVGNAVVGTGPDSQAGYTLQSPGPVIVEDLRRETRFRGPALLADHKVVSGMSVIIGRQGTPWGVLGTHSTRNIAFTAEDANFVRAVANILWDAIERHDSRQRLRDSEERYRAIVESQAEMVCRFRPDGEIIFVNGAYARAFGTTPEALAGANFWDIIVDEDRSSVQTLLDALTPDAPEIRIENRVETANGECWTLWTNRALKFDSEGRWLEGQSAGIDITERKQMEDALREADRRKDEFLATLSHELRNPLSALSNALEVIRTESLPERSAECRSVMERQVVQLARLVDDLLEVPRITLGKVELKLSRIELGAVVQSALEDVREQFDEAGHELLVQVPERPIWLQADALRLAQVLTNVLRNAAKYTLDGGRIELLVEARSRSAAIIVRDNGLGIPADKLESIFEMFGQIDHSPERGRKGLGIGLSLAKSLVEMHGGRIEAHSDGPHQGSQFTISLPVSAAPEPLVSRTPRPAVPPKTAVRCTVLVVDDNRDAAHSLAMLVEMLGHDVHVAYDGLEAVEMAAQVRPHLVLLDIGLPKLNGYDAARRMRARLGGNGMVLAAVTGWSQERDRREAEDAGFDQHIAKPVSLEMLQNLLKDMQQ